MAIFEASDALGHGVNMFETNVSYIAGSDVSPYGSPLISQYDANTKNLLQAYVKSDGTFAFEASIFYTEYSQNQTILKSIYYYDQNMHSTVSMYGVNIIINNNDNFSYGAFLTNFLSGNDDVYGNNYSDYLKSGSGDDRIYGRGGDDLIRGGAGNDLIDGGSGSDALDYSTAPSSVSVNLTTGIATGGDGQDQFTSIEGVVGSTYSDNLIGDIGNNFFFGLSGDDTIDGGAGSDTASYQDKSKSIEVTLNGAAASTVKVNGIAEDVIKNIENLIGGSGNDSLGGDGLDNVFYGLAGKDTLTGGAGDDTLDGGTGNDIAVYSVARSAANVTFDTVNHKLVVSAGTDGTDALVNVEQLRFSDGLYSFQFGDGANFNDFNAANGWNNQQRLPRLLVDVNGDGRADLLGFANFGTVVSLARADGTFEPSKLAIADYGAGVQGWLNNDTFPRLLADLNGDGRADILGFANFGAIVSLANTDGTYQNSQLAIGDFGARFGWNSQARFQRVLADVNGDHKLDLIGFGNSAVIVALGNGDGTFQPTKSGIADFGYAQGWGNPDTTPRVMADVNGDGRADIVGFASTGTMVALANTDGTFQTSKLGLADFGANAGWTSQENTPRLLGDVNGDGRADIVAFAGAGTVVALAKADGTFQNSSLALSAFGGSQGWSSQNATPRQLIDLNHDSMLDIIGFGPNGTSVAFGNGDGTFTAPSQDLVNFGLAQGWGSNNTFHREIADINGDGYPDILAFGHGATYTAINNGAYVI